MLGIPTVIGIMGITFLIPNLHSIAIHLASCVLLGMAITIPYGIPDAGDDGSITARFFFWLTKNMLVAKVLTRALCGLAYFSAMTLGMVLSGRIFAACNIIVMGIMAEVYFTCIMGNKPPVCLFGYKFNHEEFMIGIAIGIGGLLCRL